MKTLARFGTAAALSMLLGTVCFGQHYTQTNLVSYADGAARVTDPQLINPGACPGAPEVRVGYRRGLPSGMPGIKLGRACCS